MSTNIGSLLWSTGIDNTGLRKDALEASKVIDGVGHSANDVKHQIQEMAGALGIVAGGAGLVALGRQIIEVRGEFQQLNIAFETMLGSKERADKLMRDAVEFAALTPFTLTDVATNIKQLMAMGIETEKVMETMKSLGDVAAGVSVPIGRIAINYGQVAVQGNLMGKELKDFSQAGIPLAAELAKNLGKAKSEILDMVSAGRIGFPEVEQAFKSMAGEGGKFYNLMEKQNASVTGQISNLQDEWEVMLNEIGKGNEGLIYSGINGLSLILSKYETLLDILKVLVVTYGAYRAAIILTNVVQKIQTALQVYDIKTKKLLIITTLKAAAAQSALNKAFMANPFVFAVAAIVAIGYALKTMAGEAKSAEEIIDDLNGTIEAIDKQQEIDKAIEQFIELEDVTNKSAEQQEEYNDLIQKLAILFPGAIDGTNQYGDAISLATDKLIEYNEQQKEALRLGALSSKQENDLAREKLQKEFDRLTLEQTTGEFKPILYNKGIAYEGAPEEVSEERFKRNRDRIIAVRNELAKLGAKAQELDAKILDFGAGKADKFRKKYKRLFTEVATMSRDQALEVRKELDLLLYSGIVDPNVKATINKRIDELDTYTNTIKTTREEIQQWTQELADAKIKLAELQDPDYESITGTPGKDIRDQKNLIKDLKEKLGIDKKSQSDALEAAQERLEFETEIGRKRIEARLNIEQQLLDIEEDSASKSRRQAELNYKKALIDIANNKAKQLKDYRELYGQNASLPEKDLEILRDAEIAAEKVRTAEIERINREAAKELEKIRKKVMDNRLSDMDRELEAVKAKYAEELKAAKKANDPVLVKEIEFNITKESEKVTRKFKLEELDFLEEMEFRKNEIAYEGYDRRQELDKANFETFKKYQEKRIKVLEAAGDPESLKQAALLRAALDFEVAADTATDAEKTAKYFSMAASYAAALGDALRDSNSELSEMLFAVSNLAGTIGDLAAKGLFSKDGLSEDDQIAAGLSGATQLFGIVVGQAARNKKEMEDYYASIISQQHEYNLALNEQIRLNDQINGSVFYDDFVATLEDAYDALADANEERDKAMAKFWSSEAIVGKKNVISGQNVIGGVVAGGLGAIGVGAMMGAAAGPIGIIGGAIIGGLVGLFSKKKKDIVRPLLEEYPDLIDANGKFNAELAKTLIANDRVTKSTEQVLQNVIEWEEAAQKARDQITGVIQDLAGNIGNDLRDALVDAFENGTDAAEKFGESVTAILEDIIAQQLFNVIFGQALKQLEDEMNLSAGVDEDGEAVTGDGVDGNFVDDILRFYEKVPELQELFMTQMDQLQVPGPFELFQGDTTGQNTATGQIARAITEDTGSALMGLWRRSLDEQKKQSGILSQSNTYLIEISEHTLRTADNTDKLQVAILELQGINENTRKSYLNDMGL